MHIAHLWPVVMMMKRRRRHPYMLTITYTIYMSNYPFIYSTFKVAFLWNECVESIEFHLVHPEPYPVQLNASPNLLRQNKLTFREDVKKFLFSYCLLGFRPRSIDWKSSTYLKFCLDRIHRKPTEFIESHQDESPVSTFLHFWSNRMLWIP